MALIHGNNSAWLNRNATTPVLVNSNLIVHFDAANSSSYTAGSDQWANLTPIIESGVLVNGVSYSSDNSGYLVFDGSNDYVRIQSGVFGAGDNAGFSPFNFGSGEPFTLSAWIRPTGWGQGTNPTGYVISRRTTGEGYWLGIGDRPTNANGGPAVRSGVFFRRMYLNAGTDIIKELSITLSQWQNIGVTYDGTDKVVLYKNGEEIASATGFPYPIKRSGFTLIGGNDTNNFFPGGISQVVIYNTNLSSGQMLQNFNALKSRYL